MYRSTLVIFLLLETIAGCKKHDTTLRSSIISTSHQWQQINSPAHGYNSDIYFTSKDTGFMFGSSPGNYILTSVDGGTSWHMMNSFPADYPVFNCFYALNSEMLFALRDTLFFSVDGGSNWSKSTNWTGTTAYQVLFTDQQNGFILTNDKIYSTIDGGMNWRLNASLNGSFTALVFPDKLHGFAAGGGEVEQGGSVNVTSVGSLSATADGGQSWTQLDTGSWITGTQRFRKITAIDFSDIAHGLIAMDDNTLSITTDGGLDWKIQNKNLPGIMMQIKYDKAGKLFLITGNHVYSSDNDGQTVGLEFSGTDEFLKIGITPDNQAFVIGRSGEIYKRM